METRLDNIKKEISDYMDELHEKGAEISRQINRQYDDGPRQELIEQSACIQDKMDKLDRALDILNE